MTTTGAPTEKVAVLAGIATIRYRLRSTALVYAGTVVLLFALAVIAYRRLSKQLA